MIPNIHTVRGKRIFIDINLLGVLVAMLQGVISSTSDMVGMLYARWRTYVNKVVMNFVKHGCLLNEPTCIKGIKV